jgi:molecular chaperone GrpE
MNDETSETKAETAPGPESGDARLAALEAEVRQNHDRWLRACADLENFKKRAARERADAVRFGNEALIRDLLPVLDNLERAMRHAEEAASVQALVEGVALVLKSLQDVLGRHGVERVAARGERFDPAHHEAVAHVETAAHEPSSVMEEHQAGYRLNERLLRPALVTVAKAPASSGPDGGDRVANPGAGD